jgi:hypothetical protein
MQAQNGHKINAHDGLKQKKWHLVMIKGARASEACKRYEGIHMSYFLVCMYRAVTHSSTRP